MALWRSRHADRAEEESSGAGARREEHAAAARRMWKAVTEEVVNDLVSEHILPVAALSAESGNWRAHPIVTTRGGILDF